LLSQNQKKNEPQNIWTNIKKKKYHLISFKPVVIPKSNKKSKSNRI